MILRLFRLGLIVTCAGFIGCSEEGGDLGRIPTLTDAS